MGERSVVIVSNDKREVIEEKPFPIKAARDIYRPGQPKIPAGTKGSQIRNHFLPDGLYVMVLFDGELDLTCVDIMGQMMGIDCVLLKLTDVEGVAQEK